jgi:hypothetical protein
VCDITFIYHCTLVCLQGSLFFMREIGRKYININIKMSKKKKKKKKK